MRISHNLAVFGSVIKLETLRNKAAFATVRLSLGLHSWNNLFEHLAKNAFQPSGDYPSPLVYLATLPKGELGNNSQTYDAQRESWATTEKPTTPNG